MNKEEWAEHFDHNLGFQWPMTKDLNSRFSDELNEGTMLHTKAMARQDTAGWKIVCHYTYNDTRGTCRIGNPYPEGAYEQNITYDSDGWKYNCFVNEKIENYFVPRLEKSMEGTKAQFEALS
eukprot:CAMPEP_0202455526 /NCGR_PEP_ID=MMETSP1360-20130828/13042_1 /ASSEMBLY_ACC=CAM_ASM_000848 /TAXON_ID=515479 /ORGANISM="Licmophora paradoxa, Strain CCMP2313" /LENGTH=121 /DNA_ID=CAMNT_0049075127 /DNA_START=280 /DNA_END=645 /DNA_ORIENTATION=-